MFTNLTIRWFCGKMTIIVTIASVIVIKTIGTLAVLWHLKITA